MSKVIAFLKEYGSEALQYGAVALLAYPLLKHPRLVVIAAAMFLVGKLVKKFGVN